VIGNTLYNNEKEVLQDMEKQQLADMGNRLRQQRNALGLTREQFAELADIGTGYYGQIEVGTSSAELHQPWHQPHERDCPYR
jgi:DNA-binding XRE family transcriptional regulator